MVEVVQEINPELSRAQASYQVRANILPKNAAKGVLKPNLVKAQGTTSDRTGISVASQYRWHYLVEEILRRANRVNTGTCPVTGKQYGQLQDHFIIGLDEMCIMADHGGNIKIIGAADVKKQEKILQDR